jgi:hypothetical protein
LVNLFEEQPGGGTPPSMAGETPAATTRRNRISSFSHADDSFAKIVLNMARESGALVPT